MTHLFARKISRSIIRYPVAIALMLALLTGLSVWRATKLQINNNQLDLIPQDLPGVIATKQMIDITGGVGFLMLAIKGPNLDQLKGVADDLAGTLKTLPEISQITYKQDVSFVRDRVGLFIETDDLAEAQKRIRKKIRAILRDANPFHIQLVEHVDEPLVLDDLVDKYRHMNKKNLDDPYYVDDSKEMILLLIKPTGQSTDLAFTRDLVAKIEKVIQSYNQNNTHGAKLAEHYKGPAPAGVNVTYGYTGTYKTNLDDSENMNAALVPTATIAFVVMLIYLIFYMRRLSQIALIMVAMTIGVIMSYAFCEVAIGELNTITAILASVLMGLGIDYGIHLMFRLREEYSLTRDLNRAIELAVEHSGSASFASAITTAATLFLLMLSDFRGFADFGLVTGVGVLVTAMLMYMLIPVAYVLIDRVAPNFKNNLLVPTTSEESQREMHKKPFPYAKPILVGGLVITAVLGVFATQIEFDYDSRSFMSSDRPSIMLQDEINARYKISSDPVAIYTPTLEEAQALYEQLTPVPESSSIESVASVFSLVPSPEKQQANREKLAELKANLESITPDMLEEKDRPRYDELMKYLDVQPYTVADLPDYISEQFRPVPESKWKGYVTFIYPKVALWNGKDLLRFADEVATIKVGDHSYDSAGMPVLYADLAKMVLRDGRIVAVLSALIIFVIILINFRSLRGTLCAMMPLAAGLVWMLGIMVITGWRINFMNIVVFPLVFGDGVSCGIHLYHRYRECGSTWVAVKQTGSAVATSFITTLIGWAALLVSGHKGLASMGILACFGIAGALIISLTILPALLQLWQNATSKQRGDHANVSH